MPFRDEIDIERLLKELRRIVIQPRVAPYAGERFAGWLTDRSRAEQSLADQLETSAAARAIVSRVLRETGHCCGTLDTPFVSSRGRAPLQYWDAANRVLDLAS